MWLCLARDKDKLPTKRNVGWTAEEFGSRRTYCKQMMIYGEMDGKNFFVQNSGGKAKCAD